MKLSLVRTTPHAFPKLFTSRFNLRRYSDQCNSFVFVSLLFSRLGLNFYEFKTNSFKKLKPVAVIHFMNAILCDLTFSNSHYDMFNGHCVFH